MPAGNNYASDRKADAGGGGHERAGDAGMRLPLDIAGAVEALGLSVPLSGLRPWLIGAAVILLGVRALQIYRGQRSCQKWSRLSLILFRHRS